MQIVETIAEVRRAVGKAKAEVKKVGLAPTMGAFHAGHIELMRTARRECGFVIVSVFVNPAQFAPSDDFGRYPRDLEADAEIAKTESVDLIFAPSATEIYPEGFDTYVEVGKLGRILEGASRPGHFRGVATVVAKLFGIVSPDTAYFGMKDYQQLRVIQKMVSDLDFAVEIVPCPTVREPDGLAMSSRNAYLSKDERAAAVVLYRALEFAEERARAGERNAEALRSEAQRLIESDPLACVDYVAVVDPETLEPVERVGESVVIALAVRIGDTRLIDNTLIEVGG